MTTPRELLRFPGLSVADRARLVAFVARCRLISDQAKLDDEPIEPWTRRLSGDGLWERLWRPLLDSKFDGHFDDLPATYLWSRMRRTAGTRDRSGREVMGWIRGGHQALADALCDAIRDNGGEVLSGEPVRSILSSEGRVQGVVVADGFRPHDWVVSTLLRPHLAPMLGPDIQGALPSDQCRYLGVVCVVARVRRSVSPYYALNITDRSVPLTSIVETTHVVDPEHVGGHLLYVPRYVSPDSPELARPSSEISSRVPRPGAARVPRLRPQAGRDGEPGGSRAIRRADSPRGCGGSPARHGHGARPRGCLGSPRVPRHRSRPVDHRRGGSACSRTTTAAGCRAIPRVGGVSAQPPRSPVSQRRDP